MGFKPAEIAGMQPWRKAVFTTYALSLSFFESVVLDALVRGRSQEALILADLEGIRSGLSEQGAQRAGRDYEIEPVSVSNGVFHPKISAFVSDEDCHLIVGSGNLTFSGWGRNLETAEHLHPSFAADAFNGAARFFDMLGGQRGITHGAQEACASLAQDLTRAAGRGRGDGSVRFLHSLGGSIAQSMEDIADELGGATRLTVAAPFWDGGAAVDDLCSRLKVEEVHVHAHAGGTVRGTAGANWPLGAKSRVVAVAAEPFTDTANRKLHAKAFEVACRNGRLIVSGSANASGAALTGFNVEACVARVQRNSTVRWHLVPAPVPLPLVPLENEAEDDGPPPGVLRASVTGDAIAGRVLSPRMVGAAQLFHYGPAGWKPLADLTLEYDASFSVAIPGFEAASLRGGRVVFRVEAGQSAAEGFASLSAITGLRRFAGKAAASLTAILGGTETPDDFRVLLEWAHDNPSFLRPEIAGGGGSLGPKQTGPSMIPTSDLWNSGGSATAKPGGGEASRGWARFVDALLSALKERRGPIGRDDHEDEPEPGNSRKKPKAGKGNGGGNRDPLEVLDKVIDAMLAKGASRETALRAMTLVAYACDRLADRVTAAKAEHWLKRVVDTYCAAAADGPLDEEAASAILALCGPDPSPDAARAARQRFLTTRGDLGGDCPSEKPAEPFIAAMGHVATYKASWARIVEIRTWREQAGAYAAALTNGTPRDGYAELLDSCPSESRLMVDAFLSETARRRVHILSGTGSCCNRRMTLPKIEQGRLRSLGVARSANCCQKVLVLPEGLDG
ncbi:MAG: hypothetical protein E5V62_05585 [Mesorhizobium sp.]|uniref:hypothetical protein n=1 Tax=Mesorhizobium sp. TaxID=1871066 RepID=UPI000FD4AA06|nr:hypothetical protein [Mesorhizobium sp.]RVD71002.1 hypothetical protein EN751_17715 [Mesorhizobium sp. M4A.F.Ca.ET.029.04.2.1]TIW36642.1 MAG: hypothetical protein E5V62_05585 [Mesorhizobium sp.]